MDQEEKQRNYELAEKLLAEQNFGSAAMYGALAMILAASAYGLMGSGGITYSFMAAGIGLAIGFTMQFFGRGIESKFTFLASAYAVAGCLLGNMFAVVIHMSHASVITSLKILFRTQPSKLVEWMVSDLQFADLIFWIVAIGAAGYFVKRRLSREDRLALGMYEIRR